MIIGNKKHHWILLLLLLIMGCGKTTPMQEESHIYADVLDLKKLPEEISDHKASSFSDLGAWFSYAINPEPIGGFTGPYIMSIDNGVWFSKALSNLTISIDGQELDYQSTKNYFACHCRVQWTILIK